MKRNLTKIVMLVLTLCVMIAMFAVVTSAATETVVTLNETGKVYDGEAKELTNDDFVAVNGDKVLTVKSFKYKSVYFNGVAMETPELTNVGTYKITIDIQTAEKGWEKGFVVYYEITKAKVNIKDFSGCSNGTYGDVKGEASAKAYLGDTLLDMEVGVKYFEKADFDANGANATAYAKRPTDAGTYVVYFYTEATDNFAATVETTEFTIAKKAATVTVKDVTVNYGEKIELTYTAEGFLEADNVVVNLTWDEIALFGTYDIYVDVQNDNDNYDIDYTNADPVLKINQRVLTAEDFAVTNYKYDGKLHAPKATVTAEALGAYGDAECGVEIRGSSRKYGGTYTFVVVAVTNPNYTIDGEITLEYTIEAEGLLDHDNAFGEFVEGVVNAGQVAGDVVEVVTPVFNYIGNAIWDGFKNGVSALVTDFFGRVFG